MDDGSLKNKDLHLNTYGFTNQDILNLKSTLENMFGENTLKCSIHKHKKGERIYIWEESMELIRTNISQFMHKDMLYKIKSDKLKKYKYMKNDLLPYYAILRSIPNKLLGVLAMFGSLFILLILPLVDVSRIRGNQFRPAMRVAFWFFVVNFFILMWIGSQHPDSPYLEIGQISTAFYFIWFLIIVPVIGLAENTLMDIATESK